jgi:hypothetical protein
MQSPQDGGINRREKVKRHYSSIVIFSPGKVRISEDEECGVGSARQYTIIIIISS